MRELPRVVITGIGLASPNGDSLPQYRKNLLEGKSGVVPYNIRHVGDTFAGVCNFDPLRYQTRKEVRRGTRAGGISIWCAQEALKDARIELASRDRARVGVYIGITEHGNVETENQIHEVAQYGFDLSFWSHHHNPRTVANNPAGEVTLSLGISGPAYCLGGACAAGNLGLIHGMQMLQLGIVDLALGGGVSESIHTFGIFASFRSQGALARHDDASKASRPFDRDRNGIVVSEGGCLYTLERLDDALARGAKIYAEVRGYFVNSDASDFVLPSSKGQEACIRGALAHADLGADEIDIVNTHATSTKQGDEVECEAIRKVFSGTPTRVNNTKSYIGHTMGAAGALELAGNLPSFEDGLVHPTINVDNLDPACALDGLVLNEPARHSRSIDRILNMSFGMLGINSAVIVERYRNWPTPLSTPDDMTRDEIVLAIKDIIATIAPDEELGGLEMDVRLRDQIELDSMDFLDIVMELRKRYGVQVPEEDYMQLATLKGCVDYLGPKLESKALVLTALKG